MSKTETEKPLLDKMSRSEEIIRKVCAIRCIRFSVLGVVALLVTCFYDSQDILHLQNPIVKLMLIIGVVSFMIGYVGLITAIYNRKEGKKDYE